MTLDERKKRILESIIELYVGTAEPVGSRTLAKQSTLSPATIRNEMADLEELGLLEKPHTSAGRIPSHAGYRVYVDHLMKKYELSEREYNTLQGLIDLRRAEIGGLMQELAMLYSKLTHYTVFSVRPSRLQSYIKHIQVIPIDSSSILLILITDTNAIKTKVISFTITFDDANIEKMINILNQKLAQGAIDITPLELEIMQAATGIPTRVFASIFDFISKA